MSVQEITPTRFNHTDRLLWAVEPTSRPVPTVEVVIPVYNEAHTLADSVHQLVQFMGTFPFTWQITVADNASIDGTWGIACELTQRFPQVNAAHLTQKGRGRALRAVWRASKADVVAYMDVDLSTDLAGLLPLVAPLVSGHSDVAIGTRLHAKSRVRRGPKREAISRTYNLLLRTALRSGFSDAQCGFKAIRTDVGRELLPLVEDNGWFFDTELLVLAEANGLRIHEVPVDWVDDPDSRVDIVRTATDDLKGVARMLGRLARGEGQVSLHGAEVVDTASTTLAEQLVRFASIGLVSTLAFGSLFVLLHPELGLVLADVVALLACSIANTAANRRFTFAMAGRAHRRRHVGAAAAVTAVPLAMNLLTVGALFALGWTSALASLIALTVTNGLASLVRFVSFRSWVFRPIHHS